MDLVSLRFIQVASILHLQSSLLFGYSLVKLAESIKQKRDKSRWHLVRRAIGLMTIGTLHATYIWDGDILSYYGVILTAPLSLHRKPKTLLIWSGISFVLFTAASYGDVSEMFKTPDMLAFVEMTDEVHANGTYQEILDYRENAMPPIFDIDPVLAVGALLLSRFICCLCF